MYLRASPGQFPWLRCRPEPGALPGDCLGRWVIGPLGETKRKVDMVLRVHRIARGARTPPEQEVHPPRPDLSSVGGLRKPTQVPQERKDPRFSDSQLPLQNAPFQRLIMTEKLRGDGGGHGGQRGSSPAEGVQAQSLLTLEASGVFRLMQDCLIYK